MNRLRKPLALIVTLIIIATSVFAANAAVIPTTVKAFSDVPKKNFSFKAIQDLRKLGITDGIGSNRFGLGKPLTRGEFITWLVKLMGLKLESPVKGSFSDNQNKTKSYYKPIETALKNGIITKSTKFRPASYLTREEMAVMLVRCLGYDNTALRLTYLGIPYSDISSNTGYITMVRDFGLMDASGTLFKPTGRVLREQAAVSLMKTYDKTKKPTMGLNAFYAIRSDPQKDKISNLTSACFGWSRLTYDDQTGQVILNTAHDGTPNEEYYVPDGFSERVDIARQAGIPAMLSVFASSDVKVMDAASGSDIGIVEYVLTKPGAMDKLIEDISSQLANTARGEESTVFDGVTIDFEGLKGENLKNSFNSFLGKLRTKLNASGKKLYVSVQPQIAPSRSKTCFDGYDFKTIGSLADKVILMAHDYDAKSLTDSEMSIGWDNTPLTPFEDVYYALKTATDAKYGVQDRSKIMLQLSFNWAVWQKKNGKILNKSQVNYNWENFSKLLESKLAINYSPTYRNPYLKFTDPATGIERTVWYEDSRSVLEKIKLAKMFDIADISLWRLGQIPDFPDKPGSQPVYMDAWQTILSTMGDNLP